MDAKEKRQLETELVKMGLAGLQATGDPSPELIRQIAAIINGWKGHLNRHGEWIDCHRYLRDLLAECNEADRSEMYGAIVPHLNFAVGSLAHYETMIAERADRLVGKGAARAEGQAPRPIEVGGKKYVRAGRADATHAIATLHCQRCWKKKRFVADTPLGALIAARDAGWVRMPDKWTCPKCARAMARGMALVN